MDIVPLKNFIFSAGPVALPLLFCSLAGLTIIFRKFVDLKETAANAQQLQAKIFTLVQENNIKEALRVCRENPGPVSEILQRGLLEFGQPHDLIRARTNTAVFRVISSLEQGLNPLMTITNVAPLFGILGTTLGMSSVFQTFLSRAAGLGQITLTDLSPGIWQALSATIIGLVIAIPGFVAHNYFADRINRFNAELQQMGDELSFLLAHLYENNASTIHSDE